MCTIEEVDFGCRRGLVGRDKNQRCRLYKNFFTLNLPSIKRKIGSRALRRSRCWGDSPLSRSAPSPLWSSNYLGLWSNSLNAHLTSKTKRKIFVKKLNHYMTLKIGNYTESSFFLILKKNFLFMTCFHTEFTKSRTFLPLIYQEKRQEKGHLNYHNLKDD